MYVNAKKMAFLGLLLALTVILVILSGILEFNTLFLLAAASFCIGIAIREAGLRLGAGFFIGAVVLSFLLAPNKLYCITFAGMGLYLVLIETIWEKLNNSNIKSKRCQIYWMLKYLVFNIIYLTILLFLPKLIYQGEISSLILILIFVAGQAALYLYDSAYRYFQGTIWTRFRKNLRL